MSPQHLQQQDAHQQALLQARLGPLSPYGWGVLHAEPDLEALRSGMVQFHRLEVILPDGTALYLERGHPETPAARPVEEALRGAQQAVDIWLGIPREREGLQAYAQDATQAASARFRVVNRPTPDLLASHSVVPVAVAQRNVKFLLGHEPREDFDAVKVAVIKRDAMGALAFDASYTPPCLRIGAAPAVLDGLRAAVEHLLGKQRELAATRRQRDAASIEFTAQDVTRTLQLHALSGVLPVLNHLAEEANAHPHVVYLYLLQAAGQLSTFSADGDVATFPKFQFANLSETFGPLFTRLSGLLKTVALEQCIKVPLEVRPGGLHVGKLDDERLARCGEFILAVKSELPEAQVADQLPRLSKIASTQEIHRIVQAAAPGVPLTATHRPPPEVPVRAGVVYFSLSTSDPYWKNALRDRSVALYLPQPFDAGRTQLELLGIPSSRSAP